MKTAKGNIWSWLDKGYLVTVPTNIGWTKRGHNVMGRGIAAQAKARFPELPGIYGEMCRHMVARGPEVRFWGPLVLFPVKALNLETPHLSWQAPALPDLIEQSTIQLAEWTNPGERVAIPMVGCGNGGLQEEFVLTILEHYLDDDRFLLVRKD